MLDEQEKGKEITRINRININHDINHGSHIRVCGFIKCLFVTVVCF